MKIKIIKEHKDERRTYRKGKFISVQKELADKLIKEKVAEPADNKAYEAQKESKNKNLEDKIK